MTKLISVKLLGFCLALLVICGIAPLDLSQTPVICGAIGTLFALLCGGRVAEQWVKEKASDNSIKPQRPQGVSKWQ